MVHNLPEIAFSAVAPNVVAYLRRSKSHALLGSVAIDLSLRNVGLPIPVVLRYAIRDLGPRLESIFYVLRV